MKHSVLTLPAKFGITLLVSSMLTACGGGSETANVNSNAATVPSNPVQQPQPKPDLAIQAVASETSVSVGEKVELIAQGFYSEGEITKFEWQQEAGPNVALFSNNETGKAWFRAPKDAASTTITFVLSAFTNDGKTQKEQIDINVSANAVNPTCLFITSKSGHKNSAFISVDINKPSPDAAVIDLLSGESLAMNYRDCSVVPVTRVHTEIVSQSVPMIQLHQNTHADVPNYPGFEIHPAPSSTGRVTVSATVHFANGQSNVITHVINVI